MKNITFEEWWSEYCNNSDLNNKPMSFLDVAKLRDEMRLAFYHKQREGLTSERI